MHPTFHEGGQLSSPDKVPHLPPCLRGASKSAISVLEGCAYWDCPVAMVT